jgi:TetR/AcrR family transcriptional regulator, cholesterol catabolism regulator
MRASAEPLTGEAFAGMTPRRWEVLSSVAMAFAHKGYHAVGMRQIAQGLGLNQGTLYHHFQSKEHALQMVCLVGHEETLANATAALLQSEAFEPRLWALFDRHLASLDSMGDFIQVFVKQRDALPPELAAPLTEGWAKTRERLRAVFVEAIARGELRPDVDPRNGMRLVLGIYRTVDLLHGEGRSPAELRGFINMAVRTLLHGLVHSPAGA